MASDRPGAIVACPSTWYLAGPSSGLAPGKIQGTAIGDHELVLFRGARDHKVRAFAAHCAHMGCHLKGAQVLDNGLRCPLHLRHIDETGRFRGPKGAGLSAMVQPSFPVLERFGAIFVHLGAGTPLNFPEPHGLPSDTFTTRVTPAFALDQPWHSIVANACDLEHLQAVHRRRPKAMPESGALAPHIFRVRYASEVIGTRLSDRLMRRLSGNDINVTTTCLGGSLVVIESCVRARRSFLILSMRPRGKATSVQGVVGLARTRSPIPDAISVRVAAWLFLAFIRQDLKVFDGMRLHRPMPTVTQADHWMGALYDHLEGLDRQDAEPAGQGAR